MRSRVLGLLNVGLLAVLATVWVHAQVARSTNSPDASQVAGTATVSVVDATTIAPQSLIAANTNRRGAIVWNDATAVLYLKFGSGASFESYSVQIPAGGQFVMPLPTYTGEMDGIWESGASGTVYITELTP